MKRLFVLTICLCLLLAGCGEKEASGPKWEPLRASADVKLYAQQAIKIIDQYLSFEISKDAAEKQFDEVYSRIKDNEYETSTPDYYVQNELWSLCRSNLTDTEIRKCRDILSFQIGEEVSEKNYEADRKIFSDAERVIAASLDITELPTQSIMISDSNNGLSIVLFFEAMNGVKPLEINEYFSKLLSTANLKGIAISEIVVVYLCYKQAAFTLRTYTQPSEENIPLSLYERNAVAALLGEYSSLDRLPDALKVAEAYLGKYAP